jgi:hypothetical protein
VWTCTAQFLQYIDKGIVIEYTDFPTVDDDCGKHEPDTGSGWVQCPHILFSMYCNKTSDKMNFSLRFRNTGEICYLHLQYQERYH